MPIIRITSTAWRHWSLRGMTNALMDYYTDPDAVHRLFRALTDFYLRIIERAKDELGQELEALQTNYRSFRQEAPLMWKGEESLNLHQERLADYDTKLAEIKVEYAEKKSRLEVIEEALNNDTAAMSDLDRLALLSEKDVERLSLLLTATKG